MGVSVGWGLAAERSLQKKGFKTYISLSTPLSRLYSLFTQLLEGLCTEHIGYALACAVKALPPRKVRGCGHVMW